MKKTNIIIIAVICIASVALISFFGTEATVLDPTVVVTEVTCLNESTNSVEVREAYNNDGSEYTYIILTYTTDGDPVSLTGTMLQLEWRVAPDNATTQDIMFVYSPNDCVTFYTDGTGRETGLIFFHGIDGTLLLNVKIQSTDGTKVYADVKILVKY